MENIKVSILCLCFNHEKYIRKCLDGFVMQECDFEYEVLIHDDASTDSSVEIIREYEQKYPNIIKPAYQTENQFSKGVKISKTFLFPRVKGEYIALCEGDDFWTDPQKLKKQVEFLDNNPEYSACVHRAVVRYSKTGEEIRIPQISEGREFSLDEIIRAGGGIFATNSLMARTKEYLTLPECFEAKGFGDYQRFMYAAICGKVWCMCDVMSQYNCENDGSWTATVWKNPERRIAHHKEMIRMLNAVNEHYEYKFNDSIEFKTKQTQFKIFVLTNDKKSMKSKEYRPFLKMHKRIKFVQFVFKTFPFVKRLLNRK